MENGSFPKTEKEASVKPTLKSGKDQQNVESYRPISNLSFLGKTIEAAAKKQLTAHMETLNVLPGDQSAYREFHSTETALCDIVSDLLEYMDDGKCVILILLDLSAVFDTVDHELLIDDLMYIGVEGVALKWFKSYLENRSYHVIINGTKSERRTLQRGVPQGSVLGPILFSIYTIELAWILKHLSVKFKMFADDTQLYFIINNVEDTITALNSLVCDIKQWMTKKKLKLNENKTECLIIGTKHDITKYDELKEVSINNEEIVLSRSVRDLGFIIDNNLACNEQIQTVIKNANFSLRNIAFKKKYLDDDSMKKLVHNYIITRLDYCNSLYYELPAYQLKKLQLVLNRAARLVGISLRERITPVLISLHWLPIKARIVFKICVLTHIALNRAAKIVDLLLYTGNWHHWHWII